MPEKGSKISAKELREIAIELEDLLTSMCDWYYQLVAIGRELEDKNLAQKYEVAAANVYILLISMTGDMHSIDNMANELDNREPFFAPFLWQQVQLKQDSFMYAYKRLTQLKANYDKKR